MLAKCEYDFGMSKESQPPSRTAEQFVVRFPDGMRDRIASVAKDNNRSMNAEIVARLDASLQPEAGTSAESFVRELEFVRHTFERQTKSLTFGQEMLAHFLLSASSYVPEEHLKQFAPAISYAEGVINKDAAKLIEGFSSLFPELKGTETVKELQEMDEKYKRGEDVTSYLQEHVEESRAKWEEQNPVKALKDSGS